MAETDILNPTQAFWAAVKDSPNPSFGYERRTASNTAVAKARLGAPYTRDTLNDGFAFALRYDNRPWEMILRMKHFYEQFKGGYFTYIDYDGGGRHHVGRFTTPINAVHLAHSAYSVQQAIFQEIPQARMLEYPADFVNWSRTFNVLDDALNPTVATNSVVPGAWVAQLDPTLIGPSATDPTAYEFFNATPSYYTAAPAAYDWAQIQYVGWGFQMRLRTAANLGQIAIMVDGVFLCVIDLSAGARVPVGGILPPLPTGATYAGGLLTVPQMPLDTHRVMVQAYAASATGHGAIFPQVTVIV
jgi:hypothetical protein